MGVSKFISAENLLSLHAFAVYPAAIAACKSTAAVSPLQATSQVRIAAPPPLLRTRSLLLPLLLVGFESPSLGASPHYTESASAEQLHRSRTPERAEGKRGIYCHQITSIRMSDSKL